MPNTSPAAGRPRRKLLLGVLFAVCVLGMAAVVFLPIGWSLNRLVVWLYYQGHSIGVPTVVTIEAYDLALNVLLFAAPTALACLLWPRVRWWVWMVTVALGSTVIELVQFLALPRDATIADVIANAAGAALGAGVVALWRQAHNRSAHHPPPEDAADNTP